MSALERNRPSSGKKVRARSKVRLLSEWDRKLLHAEDLKQYEASMARAKQFREMMKGKK